MKREWGMIATWRMAGDAIKLGAEILNEKGKCQDAVEKAIMQVEDYPFYKSVGYGGLPNEDCEVELDAAFMDGKTLSIGAVADFFLTSQQLRHVCHRFLKGTNVVFRLRFRSILYIIM